jgi:aryl-phospho-beta-D-glucosidase BglC (GH1 family)
MTVPEPRFLSRRDMLLVAGAAAAIPACAPSARSVRTAMPPSNPAHAVDFRHLPRWRGFNLLEKFTQGGDAPYSEWDFDTIAEWGFDFVRLPTDYRIWTPSPGRHVEARVEEIDRAIRLGRERRIHVNLCLHRAPGYCVNPPRETLDLWGEGKDGDEARRQFAAQWRMFAERYHGVPSSELSFDLVNEPGAVSAAAYVRAARAAVEAIREKDPQRLIIADGTSWGQKPVPELAALEIAQSTRGYMPFGLTHYKASWVEGSDKWPEPAWPVPVELNEYLYGTSKPDLMSPLVLHGDFAPGELAITVKQVSARASLVVTADGVRVLEKTFLPAAGQGEWKESVYKPEWQIHQAVYDKRYTAALPSRAREIRLEVVDGDWLTFSKLEIGSIALEPRDVEWGARQRPYEVGRDGRAHPEGGETGMDGAKLYERQVTPWIEFSRTARIGVHVGEWGAYSHTPHAAVLAWMKDCLANWKRAGFGWALWNLRGGFGVLDSQRRDVSYESLAGHALDRRMLEMLKEDQV